MLAIVTKILLNVIDIFFRKNVKSEQMFCRLDTPIIPQIMRQMQGISVIVAICFFQFKFSFILSIERWKKLGFITFKD